MCCTSEEGEGILRVTAKADYAIRAMVELAAAAAPVKGERISSDQDIPLKFLENILLDLKHAGLVESQRGSDGGYWLGRPAAEVALADIIRAVEGPLTNVRGHRPEELSYKGTSEPLQKVWIALRASVQNVLEAVTLADVASGQLPEVVRHLNETPDLH